MDVGPGTGGKAGIRSLGEGVSTPRLQMIPGSAFGRRLPVFHVPGRWRCSKKDRESDGMGLLGPAGEVGWQGTRGYGRVTRDAHRRGSRNPAR